MRRQTYIKLAVCVAIATMTIQAQCRFPTDSTGRILTYTFDPTVTATGTVLHVSLKYRSGRAVDELEVPTEWAGETLHGIRNLRALSGQTIISDPTSAGVNIVRHHPHQQVVLAYDLVKDWTGRFRHPQNSMAL